LRISPWRSLMIGLAGLVAALSGCDGPASDRLVIATSWKAADRHRIESEFARWLEQHPGPAVAGPIRLDWLILSPGDDLERLSGRRGPPDVLLGGPAPALERLARAKRLVPLPLDGSPAWAVARRGVIRLVSGPSGTAETAAAVDPRGLAFDDPRHDPISLAWAEAQLAGGPFGEGYARLVRAAGARRRIGRQPGSAVAAVERGEAVMAPAVVLADPSDPEPGPIAWSEGVAILNDGRHQKQAAAFLEFLAKSGQAALPPPRPDEDARDVHDLLADLLGATLVDAQDEAWDAWSALERNGDPPAQIRSMTEPPPWPPASIAKILDRQDEPAMTMVETLAGQLATDPSVRSWLVRSWLSPPRLIDQHILEEFTRAADGRLIREPRFREWLRAEWTAWARQRYRRVLRVVDGTRR
jgi:ABC-type glycerol-3-phosphate transport system substrate-binding protein